MPLLLAENVPAELQAIPQWVRWKVEPRSNGEKPTKIPYRWFGSRRAKVDDPATWGGFGVALQYLPMDLDTCGLGFVFADGGGLVGIDLDGCRDPESGNIKEWAVPILERFHGTYAEISPSQTGIKIFARGRLPTDRTGKKVSMPGDHCGIEAYQRGRFFCVTGRPVSSGTIITDCQPALDWLWETYLRATEGIRKPSNFSGHVSPADHRRAVTRAAAYLATMAPGIQGQNGSGATFRAACELYRFGLSDAEAGSLLDQFNGRCVPPWSDDELQHKLSDARDEVNESGEFGCRLIEDGSPPGQPGSPAGQRDPPKPNESDDDYHRLARVNLEQYASRHGGRTLRYWRDEWYVWRDTHYRRITEKELRAKITHACKREFDRVNVEKIEDYEYRKAKVEIKEGEDKGLPFVKKVSTGLVSSVLGATAGITNLSSFIEPMTWLPTRERKNYVAMENGIIDMDAVIADRDDYLIPHSPEWFSTICLPYAFNPEATCPKWEAFLERNLEMDPERIKLLQEWAGYLLLPDTGQQKFLVLEGEGANGKSVFCAGIEAMLGAANVSHVPLEVFGEKFELTSTLDRLANICGDAGEIDKVAEGHIKAFTAGNPMSFGRKYLDSVERSPTARLMLACNNRPRFSDRSDGIWRRMLLVPWRIQISPEDRIPNMDKPWWWERSGELPGMLLWAIQGLHRLQVQGRFTTSAVCEEALSDYRGEMNPARTFLIDFCEHSDTSRIWCSKLYELYAKWSRESGHHPLSDRQFGKEVVRKFPRAEKKRASASEGRRYYYEKICFSCDEICGEKISDSIFF